MQRCVFQHRATIPTSGRAARGPRRALPDRRGGRSPRQDPHWIRAGVVV